jgi:hypothetical protein
MNTVLARLLQPTWLMAGLVIVLALLVVLSLAISADGLNDAQQLVGPFRWSPSRQLA